MLLATSSLKILPLFSCLQTVIFVGIFGQRNPNPFEYFQYLDPFKRLVRGPGYEEIRLSQVDPTQGISQARWLVIGSRKVVPGSVYRVVTQVLSRGVPGEDLPLTIRAAITHNYQQVSFRKTLVQPGDLSHILLRIPDTSVQGVWQLRIEGYEGNSQLPVFKNVTRLKFSAEFLTILIQTSRPVYNAGQTVRFRAVMLTRELKPYEGPVDCFVLDSRGRIMRRWPSRQTGNGVVNLNFQLPDYPLLGEWTIQVQARQQVQNKTILVEQYFKPRFEVFVRLPQTFKVTDFEITGVVVANMTNWRDVYGNCSIQLQLAVNEGYPVPTKFETVHHQIIPKFRGHYAFYLPMTFVGTRAGDLKDIIIRVYASVTDAFGWTTQHGWALARIVQERAKVQFLGDQPLFFRPGMPITVHVFASYADDHPFEDEELRDATLTVTFSSTRSMMVEINGTELTDEGGVVMSTYDVPSDAARLEVSARFVSRRGLTAVATLYGITYHSPRDRHLQVETSTFNAVAGENIVLHVRNNFFIDHINYLIVANGHIVYNGREYINGISLPTITTFSIPASAEMAPVAKVLVWAVDQDKEVVAHALAVPVNPLGRHKVTVIWNEHKDHTGGSAEIKFIGETGAFFAASALWEETHMMEAGIDLDKTRVLFHMMGFHDFQERNTTMEDIQEVFYGAVPHVRRASTKSREGYGSSVRFFPTTIAGPDAPTTFNFSEVVLFTDAMVYYHPSKATGAPSCESEDMQLLKCLTGSCYSLEQRCDGKSDCSDSSDEAGCPVNIDPLRTFRLHRISRIHRFYDPSFGDWAWQDIRRVGREIKVFPIPKRPQNWVFSMFAVGKQLGLGIFEQKVQFDSPGPFVIMLEGPKVARMWEQVGLTVSIFNFFRTTVGVLITLPESSDYQTIMVENNGVVNSYDPRRGKGTLQHVVWLPGGASADVHIPIIFTRMGEIEVTVEGATQMQRDSHSIIIQVIPEGVIIGLHTAILFDLKDRALIYEFINIALDETPIIPYTLRRRYVFGTPQGHISLTGDVVGPAFPEIPVNEGNLLGFSVMGAETSTFNFAANIWSLHYLRLTNQITDNIIYEVLNAANVYYADLARYQVESGGFTNWIGSEESVWLTAHALKNLWVANFQDWENYIYIDHDIIRKGVEFLLRYQTELGSFQETSHYIHPLNSKVDPRSRLPHMPRYQNISLTAHVVIALQSVMTGLEGELHNRANLAKQRAVIYLEQLLHTLTDPYDLAVTAWALTKADSEEMDVAYSALDKMKWVAGDRVYWSRERIEFHPVIYEDSQRPYLQPKPDNRWDAHAVEATAYALMVYIKREGIGIIQENIIRFLASMREVDGGEIASLDTLAALEALVEYSYRARIRDITDMTVFVEQSAFPNKSLEISLQNPSNLAAIRSYDLDALFGHVSIVGRGSGQALLQLDYSYGVDVVNELEVPPVPSFRMDISSRFTGFNNSHITVTSCQSWINTNETETSGLTVLQIHLPSGYYIMQDKLIDMVDQRNVRELRWALVTDTYIKFFFNKLDSVPVCLTYAIERWYPVSNHSRYNQARIYELFQPERFEVQLYETFPLYSLDICEVCGSYQCPYCPFYSRTIVPAPAEGVLLTSLLFILLFHDFRRHRITGICYWFTS